MPRADLSRERVNQLQGSRTQAVASVRPAYISAPAISGGGELEQLADSLGQLAPRLRRMAAKRTDAKIASSKALEAHQKDAAENLANQTLAGKTLAQVDQEIKDGTLEEYHNPYFRAAVDKIRGVRQAREESRGIQEKIASGEIDPLSDDFVPDES